MEKKFTTEICYTKFLEGHLACYHSIPALMDCNSLYQLLRTANPPLTGDHEAARLFDANHMAVENISLCPEQQK
jgi:hypothetical protein